MYTHPNSIGHNHIKQFPEIFTKYSPLYFSACLSGTKMGDYYDSSSFLYPSQKTNDINLLFSAIQRLYGEKHKAFYDYLLEHCEGLLKKKSKSKFKLSLNPLWEKYNDQYGMTKAVVNFYIKYLKEDEKKVITSKMKIEVNYRSNSRKKLDDSLKIRLQILLDRRHKLDHAANYIPFSDGQTYMDYDIVDNNKSYKLLDKLSFKEFYEFTRRAMKRFFLKEYEKSYKNGGDKKIKEIVDIQKKQYEKLNKKPWDIKFEQPICL